MKKVIYILLIFVVIGISRSTAQVTIGSINTPNATLDVRLQATATTPPDGILVPRITGDQLAARSSNYGSDQDGALVFVTAAATTLAGSVINVKSVGFYYYSSRDDIWVPIAIKKPEWFYMPPTPINVEAGTGKTINLFTTFLASVTTGSIKSGGLDFLYIIPYNTAESYDYYVVGYDDTVFDNISISNMGVMTYDIIGLATDESYINIIFVAK